MIGARSAILLALAGTALAPAAAGAVNPGSASTSTGQPLNIRIDTPVDGTTVPVAPLDVTGIVALGTLGSGGGANTAYVVDNSGSTANVKDLDCNGSGGPDAGDNFNGDSRTGDILDCEIAGVLALNNSIAGSGAAAGLVSFGDRAAASDVSPAAGDQPAVRVAEDSNGNGQRDIEEAARSITDSGVTLFTPKSSGGGTNYDGALTEMNKLFSGGGVAFFLSDGVPTTFTEGPGSPLEEAKGKGIVINTYAVGAAAGGCADGKPLRKVSDTTGGACTEATDPSKLAGAIGGAPPPRLAGIDRVELSMNGQTVAATLTGGTFAGQFPASALRSGANQVVATALATDGTRAAADVTVNVRGSTGSTPPAFGPRGVIQGLPSNRRCISRRAFRIRIVRRRGRTYVAASVRVNQRVVFVRRGRRITSVVNLRGLPKGRYVVDIRVVTSLGEVIRGVRRYKTCTRKERGRNRIPL